MSVCTECEREMKTAPGCTATAIVMPTGETFSREAWPEDEAERCGDCGAKPGGFHHPGCDIEYCPACGRQVIGSCECDFALV